MASSGYDYPLPVEEDQIMVREYVNGQVVTRPASDQIPSMYDDGLIRAQLNFQN